MLVLPDDAILVYICYIQVESLLHLVLLNAGVSLLEGYYSTM